jgi:hypothetical protein
MKTFTVDGWNNFCRVFELPEQFSNQFCFGGGIPTNFQMVDWFSPIPDTNRAAVSKEVWREKVGEIPTKEISYEDLDSVVEFLHQKQYLKSGRTYLIIFNFGAAITFEAK